MKKLILLLILFSYSSLSYSWQPYSTAVCEPQISADYSDCLTNPVSVACRIDFHPDYLTYGYTCNDGSPFQQVQHTIEPPCTEPQVWDQDNQECITPVDCTPGMPVDFSLPKDTFPSMCIDGGQCRTTNVDGCLVSYGEPVDCYLDGELAYCNYNGTTQGTADPLTPDNSHPFNVGLTPDDLPTENNCITTATAVICGDSLPDPENPNQQCGTMNGELFCLPDDPDVPFGCAQINGSIVCPQDADNCITSNGQNICLQPLDPDDINPDTNTLPDGCITDGTRVVCVNDTVRNNDNTVTTTNPDGSTTTITTNDNNIAGSGSTITTTIISADGNTITTSTETTGEGGLATQREDDKEDEPERTFSGSECPASIACSGDPINCGIAKEIHKQRCADQDIAEAIFGQDKQPDKATIQSLIMDGETYDGTPAEFSVGLLNTGRFSIGGSCPAPRTYDVMGSNFTLDLSGFCTLASMIGVFVSIGSSLLALRMIAA